MSKHLIIWLGSLSMIGILVFYIDRSGAEEKTPHRKEFEMPDLNSTNERIAPSEAKALLREHAENTRVGLISTSTTVENFLRIIKSLKTSRDTTQRINLKLEELTLTPEACYNMFARHYSMVAPLRFYLKGEQFFIFSGGHHSTSVDDFSSGFAVNRKTGRFYVFHNQPAIDHSQSSTLGPPR